MKLLEVIKSFFYKFVYFFSQEAIKEKAIKNFISRKTQYLKHNLYINNIKTRIKIIHLKNQQMINDNLVQLNELDYNVCYFANFQNQFNSLEFTSSFDIVITDLSWNIIKMYKNFLPNQIIPEFDKISHVFIFSLNSIIALNLNIGDTICVAKKH